MMDYIEKSKVVFKAPRPEIFARNPFHCEECVEVEKNAQEADIETLTLKQAGDGYASFACFLSDEAFLYYFPAFIRLTIETTMDDGYLDSFIFAVTVDEENNSRLKSCSIEQKKLICDFLKWCKKEQSEIITQWMVDDTEISEAIALWAVE